MAHLEDLPESMQPIAEVIGLEPVLRLMTRHGGDRVFVPKRLTLVHPLVDLLGLEAALALSFHCGGDYLEIPIGARMRQANRDREICALRRQGATVSALTARFHLSRRRIRDILATGRGSPAPAPTETQEGQ